MRKIAVERFPITLGTFLKLAGIEATGGQAKYLIESGFVTVNGAVERRRGKKLSPGDVVAVDEAVQLLVEG